MAQWPKPVKSGTGFLRNYFSIRPDRHFILINDSGFYYFLIRKNSLQLMSKVQLSKHKDFNKEINNFVGQLNNNSEYIGQEVVCLVGGSNAFYQIKEIKGGRALDPASLFSYLNLENILLKFRYFRADKRRWIFYSGIDKDFHKKINENFSKAGILIKEILPLTFFLLDALLKGKMLSPSAFKFPGEVVYFNYGNNISFFEKSFDETNTEPFQIEEIIDANKLEIYSFGEKDVNHDQNVRPLSNLFKPSVFQFRKGKSFFDLLSNERSITIATSLSEALRILVILFLAFSVILLIGLAIFSLWKSSYNDVLDSYQTEYQRKSQLQNDISVLEERLKKYDMADFGHTSFAGAISSFCQRRPWGLYLKEINLSKDQENKWALTAIGSSEKESDAFAYREYVSEAVGKLPLEVTLLEKSIDRYGRGNQQQSELFNFRIKLSLSGIK